MNLLSEQALLARDVDIIFSKASKRVKSLITIFRLCSSGRLPLRKLRLLKIKTLKNSSMLWKSS